MSAAAVEEGLDRARTARRKARWSEVTRVLDRLEPAVMELAEDDALRTRWAVDLAEAMQMVGGSERARGLAAAALRGSEAPEVRGKAMRVLGMVTWRSGDLRGGRALLERALDTARRCEDRDTAVRAGVALSNVALDQGQLEESEGLLEEATAWAGEDPVLQLLPLPAAANTRQRRSDREGARLAYGEALERARSVGHRLLAAMCLHGLANLALEARDGREAIDKVAEAHRAYAKAGYTFGEAQAWNALGEAYRLEGDPSRAIRAYERAIRSGDNVGHVGLLPRANLAVLRMEAGRIDEARTLIQDVLREAERRGARPLVASMHALLLPCVADEEQKLAHHLARAADGLAETGVYDRDLALAARRAAERTDSHELAARCRALALAQFDRLGATEEATREQVALKALADLGASVPAGPFDLHEPLGSGAMGEVFAARHRLGFDAAVKVVSKAARRPRLQAMLEGEARAVVGLDHPNIVRLIDYGTLGASAEAMRPRLAEGAPWFAMEVVRGGDLEALCGRLPWDQARVLLLQILDALAHAHARGVLHLDVKPANVLLTDEPEPTAKLVDFGLAAVLAVAGDRVKVAGTPLYMAPEQFRGEPRDWGPWTDLYALGCLAVHLVCGQPPFGGDDLRAIRDAHLRGEPLLDLPDDAPEGFEDWVRTLLARDPSGRYRFAADAAGALRWLQDDHHTMPLGRPVGARSAIDRARSGLALFELRRPPLVGRTTEKQALWEALAPVLGETGPAVVVLRGSAGAGKSALARWATERAHARGQAWILGDGRAPDDPIAALVVDRLRLEGLEVDAAVARVRSREPALPVADARDLVAMGTGERPAGFELRRGIDALIRLLDLDCADRPVLLRVEASPLDWPGLARLGDAILASGLPVGLILELRPEELPRGRRGRQTVVEGECVVEVGALSDPEIRELLEAMLPLQPALGEALTERAAGNPWLALALLGSLIRRDAVAVSGGGVVLRPGARVEFPEALAVAWRERLDGVLERLGEDAGLALTIAALLGSAVRMEDWRTACEAAGIGGLSRVLRKLRQARLAVPTADRGFRFAHPIVREVVLELARGRGLYELACGAAAVAPGLDDQPARRGLLLSDAGDLEEAVPLLEEGAREALSQGEVLHARDLIRRADDALRALGVPGGDLAWARLDLVRCRVCLEEGDCETGEVVAERVLTLARRAGDEALRADALRWIATFDWIGRRGELAMEGFEDALEAFAGLADRAGQARCLHGMAIIHRFEGAYREALHLLERARELLAEDPDPELEAAVCCSVGDLHRRIGDYDGAIASFERAVTLAREHEPTLLSTALLGLGELSRKQGDLDGAERHYREALRLRRGGQRLKTASVLVNLGLVSMAREEWNEAETLFGEAIDLLDASERSTMVMWARIALLPVAAQRPDAAWNTLYGHVEHALGGAGMQDPDMAWCLELAGDRAAAAGRSERAAVCWRAAKRSWGLLGETDRVRALEERLGGA